MPKAYFKRPFPENSKRSSDEGKPKSEWNRIRNWKMSGLWKFKNSVFKNHIMEIAIFVCIKKTQNSGLNDTFDKIKQRIIQS